MIDDQLVEDALRAPDGWVDTPEQAQLRAALFEIIRGHEAPETINLCEALIEVLRDQLMTSVGMVRRNAALSARNSGMSVKDIAAATERSVPTIQRLLTEARARSVAAS